MGSSLSESVARGDLSVGQLGTDFRSFHRIVRPSEFKGRGP